MAFLHARHADDPLAGLWEITAWIVRETEKAIQIDDGTRREWVPRRKVRVEKNRDGTVAVAMPEWLAKEKGFV